MELTKKDIEIAKDRIKRGVRGELLDDATQATKHEIDKNHPQPRVYFSDWIPKVRGSKIYRPSAGTYKFKHHQDERKFTVKYDKRGRIYVKFAEFSSTSTAPAPAAH